MILLFDYDSMVYKASYRVVSFGDIRQFFLAGMTKEAMREEIVLRSIDRMQNMEAFIFNDIEQTGCVIDSVEYYLTTCSKSFRKELSQEYKSNRKRNKWVSLIRNKVLAEYSAIYNSDTHEADDLIAARAQGLTEQGIEYVICSLDKDLQQIEGLHYNYYKDRGTGEVRGLKFTTKFDSFLYFWKSLLTGDSGDRISGVKGIGEKKAAKILEGKKTEYAIKRAVLSTYLLVYGKEAKQQLELNYKLLKLGI